MRNRMSFIALALVMAPALLSVSCRQAEPSTVATVRFDPEKRMSGKKIALTTFDKDFPSDWSGYNYLVMTLRTSTSQYMYLGMNTDSGYAEASVTFYASDGWIRTAIPLDYFRSRPAASHDLAATFNKKRPFAHIGLHGTQHELTGVDSIGIRMNMPVADSRIDIADVSLAVEDPGDKYFGSKPIVDEFGQWNLGEFEGKVHSEEELRAQWDIEPGGGGTVVNPLPGMYVEKAPEGFTPPLLAGTLGRVVRVQPSVEGSEDHIVWLTDWNLYRRHGGEETARKANQLNIDRMKAWGMNTIGNWSSRDVIALGKKPFMISLSGLGINTGILGMPDVYAEGFSQNIDEGVRRSVEPYVGNKMLIGYFVGNEPTWSNIELRLCELIMEADDSRPLKQALQTWLQKNGDSDKSRIAFVYHTYEIFLSAVSDALHKYDPNHLNLGIRYGSGVPSDEVLKLSKKYFDVYSFNNYGLEPSLTNMDKIYKATGMPMIIGEYHFGTTDRGLGESLVRVPSQKERGVAYKNYTEKAFSHPALIGTSWFTWYDQPLFGRGDGENYNIGLLDATDRPYEWMVKAIREVSEDCYDVHAGRKAPFSQRIER
mgnify:CR=1 FL=1